MKKFILIILSFFILTSCSFMEETSNKIVPPTLTESPIKGKWTISKIIFGNDKLEDSFGIKNYIGKESAFTVSGAVIGDYYIKDPTYKTSLVKSNKFLNSKYNLDAEKLGIKEDMVNIIDVYEKNELFCEILYENSENVYLIFNGMGNTFLKLSLVKDDISEEDFQKIVALLGGSETAKESKESQNGFLLGLKVDENQYKTLYFNIQGNKLQSVDSLNYLIFPKNNEFLKLKIENEDGNDILKFISNETNEAIYKDNNKSSSKELSFITGDYFSYESLDKDKNKKFSTFKFENVGNLTKIDLDDITKNGLKIFKDHLKTIERENIKATIDIANIALKRDNGYWKLFGRINFDESEKYVDFDVNTILPKNIIKNEVLSIPMTSIKNSLPNVKDAFTSPNNKILITLENNLIKVYNIEKGKIDAKPIYSLEVNKARVVMTEWSIGNYTNIWEKYIKSLGGNHEQISH